MPQADGNVPFIGKARYALIGVNASAITHKMAGVTNFAGDLPQVGTTIQDPTVTAGKAVFGSLTKGGLFAFNKKPLIIEQLFANKCTVTWQIVDTDSVLVRPTPATTPFKLAANEWLKATSTGAVSGAEVGVLVKLDGERFV